MEGGAHPAPVHAHAGPLLVAAQHIRQRLPGGREQELVAVDEGDPARIVAVALEAVGERELLPRVVGPFVHDHRAVVDERPQHLQVVVVVLVVVHEEALDSLQAVEHDPFAQVFGRPAVDRADGEVRPLGFRRHRHMMPLLSQREAALDFNPSPRTEELREQLIAFMDEHVYPAEAVYQQQYEDPATCSSIRRSSRI